MNLFVDVLANVIISQYFITSRCLIIITDEFNTFNYNGNLPVVQVQTMTNVSHNLSDTLFHYFGCQEIIMKTNSPVWLLKNLEREIRLTMERFNDRKYLILAGNGTEDKVVDVFKLKELDYISDLLVVQENFESVGSINSYNILTHKYFGAINNSDCILLDVWWPVNKTFMLGNNLFPNKLINQMGRALRIATFEYEPYSIIGPTPDEYKGSELSTAVAFAKMYNMTPFSIINPEDYWGEIFDNWTGNGLLGNLVIDKADIGLGALYTWEVDYHFLDLSKPLVRSGITCLVPAPKLAAGWLTPLRSYSKEMWIAVVVIFLVSSLSLLLIQRCYGKIYGNINMYYRSPLLMLGQSLFSIYKLFLVQLVTSAEIPRGLNGSYFMGLLFLLNLFLASTYSSGLSSIMTVPRYDDAINTVEEFLTSGLPWGATQDAWITSIQQADEPIYKEIVSRFHAISEEELREKSKTGQFGFSIERLPHENYAIGSYIKQDIIGNLHLMQQDLYWEQCVIMTRKSSVLLPLLDMFILRVFETGLISYWQNEAIISSMDSIVQKAVKYYYYRHKEEHTLVKLKWVHVEGAFGALCIGCIISIFVFTLEIIINRLQIICIGH